MNDSLAPVDENTSGRKTVTNHRKVKIGTGTIDRDGPENGRTSSEREAEDYVEDGKIESRPTSRARRN